MISVNLEKTYLISDENGEKLVPASRSEGLPLPEAAAANTITYGILEKHNTSGNMRQLKIKYDALASHDITYVGIIQTARASGLKLFPVPYVLTNCHNSLCAVGGTINEDDHLFGLSAAKKYGGEFVPAHVAVIHQYMRERFAGCGKMILASDSHTRYGALGCLSVGEGGPEISKQLLGRTYDIDYPEVVAVYLKGKPVPGVGPQDVALALIGATFKSGAVKNKVLEFVGPGVCELDVDYRMGIDVMTTETTCLSSVWKTDERVNDYLTMHGRKSDYSQLTPGSAALYDAAIEIDLSKVVPMIAMPVHPSNVYKITDLIANSQQILTELDKNISEQMNLSDSDPKLISKLKNNHIFADQGVIAGCAGGLFGNLMSASDILRGKSIGNGEFWLSVYPASQPVMAELMRNGAMESIISSGATLRSAFCGPCFGAGDVPGNGGLSIRHTTRNFPNREGSKPGSNQIAYVALMDARSIAASAINGGRITPATEYSEPLENYQYNYDDSSYKSRVYSGYENPNPDVDLKFGPNIADWPTMIELPEDLLLTVASAIYDPVTTTDELIPSGETSSYRSNPLKLAEFTLSRKDPEYVGRAKEVNLLEKERRQHAETMSNELETALMGYDPSRTGLGSVVVAIKPGDGSAREQAASCQRVLGGVANIATEYATRRYRANLINWGMIPFTLPELSEIGLNPGDRIYIPNIRTAVSNKSEKISATVITPINSKKIILNIPKMTDEEYDTILSGCLINYYSK